MGLWGEGSVAVTMRNPSEQLLCSLTLTLLAFAKDQPTPGLETSFLFAQTFQHSNVLTPPTLNGEEASA